MHNNTNWPIGSVLNQIRNIVPQLPPLPIVPKLPPPPIVTKLPPLPIVPKLPPPPIVTKLPPPPIVTKLPPPPIVPQLLPIVPKLQSPAAASAPLAATVTAQSRIPVVMEVTGESVEQKLINFLRKIGIKEKYCNDLLGKPQFPQFHQAINARLLNHFKSNFETQLGFLPFKIEGLWTPTRQFRKLHVEEAALFHLILRYLGSKRSHQEFLLNMFEGWTLALDYEPDCVKQAKTLCYCPPRAVALNEIVDGKNRTFGSFLKTFQKTLENMPSNNYDDVKEVITKLISIISKLDSDINNHLTFACLRYYKKTDEYPIGLRINSFDGITNNNDSSPKMLVWFLQYLDNNPLVKQSFDSDSHANDGIEVQFKDKFLPLPLSEAIQRCKHIARYGIGNKPVQTTTTTTATSPPTTTATSTPTTTAPSTPTTTATSTPTSALVEPPIKIEGTTMRFIAMHQKLGFFDKISLFKVPDLRQFFASIDGAGNYLERQIGFLPFYMVGVQSPNGTMILQTVEESAAFHLLLRDIINDYDLYCRSKASHLRARYLTQLFDLFNEKGYRLMISFDSQTKSQATKLGYILPSSITLDRFVKSGLHLNNGPVILDFYLNSLQLYRSHARKIDKEETSSHLSSYFSAFRHPLTLFKIACLSVSRGVDADYPLSLVMRDGNGNNLITGVSPHLVEYFRDSLLWLLQHLGENPKDYVQLKTIYPLENIRVEFLDGSRLTIDKAIQRCQTIGRTPAYAAVSAQFEAPAVAQTSIPDWMEVETIPHDGIKPLAQVLQENVSLMSEADRLFKLLSIRFFLKREKLFNCLMPQKGIWHFEFDQESSNELSAVLNQVLNENKKNSALVLSVVQEFMQYIPFNGWIEMGHQDGDNQSAKTSYPMYGPPLEQAIVEKIVPILIKIKSLELAKMPLAKVGEHATERQIPCYGINRDQDTIKLDFLIAYFSKQGLLMGFTKDDKNVGEQLLLQHGLLDPNPAQSSGIAVLRPERLDTLKNLLQSKGDRIPPFMVLELNSLSPPPPANAPVEQTIASTAKPLRSSLGGSKRKRGESSQTDDADELFVKKRKLPATISAGEPQIQRKNGATVVKDTTNTALPPRQEGFQWDNLWTTLSLKTIEQAAVHFKKRACRQQFSTTPLDYPILNLIAAPFLPQEFKPFNQLLKPYQLEEVNNLLASASRGYSRLLAFEIGVGKSLIIIEFLLQIMVKANKGLSLIVLPKAVGEQMIDELKTHCAVVSAAAWIQKKDKSLADFVDKFSWACSDRDVYQMMAYLPLLALADENELRFALTPRLLPSKSMVWKDLFELLNNIFPILGVDQQVFSKEQEVFDQLLAAGKKMLLGIQNKHFEIAESAIIPLTELLARDSRFCSKVDEWKVALSTNCKFIVISYETFQAISEELLIGSNINCIVFDEAQRMHSEGTGISIACDKRIKQLKAKNPDFVPLLSTATPFENDLAELLTLIDIANPSMLPKLTREELIKNLEDPQTYLRSGNGAQFAKIMIKAFAHIEVFRKEVMIPLLARKKRDHQQVVRDWGGAVPTRRDEVIRSEIAPPVFEKLDQALAELKEADKQGEIPRNAMVYTLKVRKILLHQSLHASSFDLKSPGIDNIIKLFKRSDTQEIETWIKESTTVSHLLNAPVFIDIFEKKEHTLILTAHLAEAEIMRFAILSRHSHQAEVRVYEGKLKTQERNEVYTWFKTTHANKVNILILMKKAGGLGLNFSKATKIFNLSEDWNPSVDDQAEGRPMRINSVGVRTFVHFNHQTFCDHHIKAVRKGKIAAEALFNDNREADPMQQLRLFGSYILKQCYKTELYESKDIDSAKAKRAQMKDMLNQFYETVDKNGLAIAIEASTPEVHQILTW